MKQLVDAFFALDAAINRFIFAPILAAIHWLTGASNRTVATVTLYTGVALCIWGSYLLLLKYPLTAIVDFPITVGIAYVFLRQWPRTTHVYTTAPFAISVIRMLVLALAITTELTPLMYPTLAYAFRFAGYITLAASFYFITNDRPKRPGLVGRTLASLLHRSPATNPQGA